MQTSAHSRQTPLGAKKANVWQPLESPPDSASRFFWLYCYLEEQAQLDVLWRIRNWLYAPSKARPLIERLTLISACLHQQVAVDHSFKFVLSRGLLPFAWDGTNVFAEQVDEVAA